jgi:sorbitol/mannitol transport system substrate-binding protein
VALATVVGVAASACGSSSKSGTAATTAAAANTTVPAAGATTAAAAPASAGEINVAIVDNPQMKDIAQLTPELFTAKSGIKVNFTVLPEGELRQITTRDVATGGKQFDAVMIGMYEAPQFGANGFVQDLTPMATADASYQLDDIIPSVKNGLSANGKLYAAPFYAESSFLMYRKDIVEAAGEKMPDAPTWDQVAAIAKKINKPDMAGICLRGKPGWGDLGAAFTTVLNTYGGTWWSAKADGTVDKAMVDQPEFKQALSFYVDLVKAAGEKDAANSSFNECLSQYKDGKVAMWYDATVAAGLLEASDSPVKGKNGFALAPVNKTKASGWLWSWALAIPKTNTKPDNAWKFLSFATGPDYLKQAGAKVSGGWAAVPPGTRKSLYAIPEYKAAAAAFADTTLAAMAAAPIDNPGTTKRPGLPGVQFVGIPEFQDVGNRCTEQFSSVIAGKTDIDTALKNCQDIAATVKK